MIRDHEPNSHVLGPRVRLGIIGGYGPLTSAVFCQRLVRYALAMCPEQAPAFIMDSLSVSFSDVSNCIHGDSSAAMSLARLANSGIRRLAALGVQHIALPCNSIHALWHEFFVPQGIQLIHIADPIVARLIRHKYRRIGLLASSLTINHDIYFSRLRSASIEYIKPSPALQNKINDELSSFVQHGHAKSSAGPLFDALAYEFADKRVDALVLACTDLSTMLEKNGISLDLPAEDSLDALAEICANLVVSAD